MCSKTYRRKLTQINLRFWLICAETLNTEDVEICEHKQERNFLNVLTFTNRNLLYELKEPFWCSGKYRCTGGHSGMHVSFEIPIKLRCGLERRKKKKPSGAWSTKSTSSKLWVSITWNLNLYMATSQTYLLNSIKLTGSYHLLNDEAWSVFNCCVSCELSITAKSMPPIARDSGDTTWATKEVHL